MPTSLHPAIRVSHLSKRYQLGLTHAGSIRELLSLATDRLLGRKRQPLPHEFEKINGNDEQLDEDGSFWALKDVSFEVPPGEVLGIIGRNGAGKSTVLKILSRITPPTEGHVEINGRVASLLEVGTGFHPELTGRENVFLNGAILGMTKGEIRRKFDEIVAFAELEQFIDTPVKRYSSGMYVRLAFAVAAHLEPEILIVDEVLAVGDADFQKKCLGKMQDVSRGGRTVLFVSHNMNAIHQLCSTAILLKHGKLEYSGHVSEGLLKYSATTGMEGIVTYNSEKSFKPYARITQLEIIADGQTAVEPLRPGAAVIFNFNVTSEQTLSNPGLTVGITNSRGERVFAVGTPFGPNPLPSLKGNTRVGICFILPPIQPGVYQLDVAFYDQHEGIIQEIYGAGCIEMAEVNYLAMAIPATPHLGHVLVRSSWTIG